MLTFHQIKEWFSNKQAVGNKTLSGDYYQQANHWYQEVYENVAISRDRYRLLSIGLGTLLALSLTLTTILLPLKQYVYRLIEVNQQSGEVMQLKEIEGNRYAANWVVTRYFINQYVLNRHSYHFDDIKRTFNNTLALSNKEIANSYSNQIVDTNPYSPINTLNKNYYREVTDIVINQLNDHSALVRFSTLTHNRTTSSDVKKEDFQAVIKWEYENPANALSDRDKNPLGFTVTFYQVSPINSQAS